MDLAIGLGKELAKDGNRDKNYHKSLIIDSPLTVPSPPNIQPGLIESGMA